MPPSSSKKRVKPEPEDDEYNSEDQLGSDDGGHMKRVPGLLSPPQAGTLKAIDLHKQIHEGTIDLDPDFQREVVWTDHKQIGLILSLAQNYPIPPIYFSLRIRKNGAAYRVCLDGKQRLTAIQKFFDGLIPYVPEGSKARYYYKANGQSKRQLLDDEMKRVLASKPLTCVEYRDLSEMQERDMFQRVQLGMPLKEGEKLQSLGCEWAAWCRVLCRKYVEPENGLSDILDWKTERGTGFQGVATLVALIHGLPEREYKSYAQLNKFLQTTPTPSTGFKDSVDRVFSRFIEIASNNSTKYPFAKGTPRVAPVEFVFIGLLIYLLYDESKDKIALEIQNTRVKTREQHEDVRANSRVIPTMWDLVQGAASKAGSKRNRYGDGDEYMHSPAPARKRTKV